MVTNVHLYYTHDAHFCFSISFIFMKTNIVAQKPPEYILLSAMYEQKSIHTKNIIIRDEVN